MSGINKVIVLGNVGKEPEVRTFDSGDTVTNFSVATSEKWKDKTSGESKESTEWHRVSCFGKLSEIASKYVKKGDKIYVEGSLRTRKWTDATGVEKYSTEIKAEKIELLGGKQTNTPQGSIENMADDAIPF
jgi:single-strand DNA-binding protein